MQYGACEATKSKATMMRARREMIRRVGRIRWVRTLDIFRVEACWLSVRDTHTPIFDCALGQEERYGTGGGYPSASTTPTLVA